MKRMLSLLMTVAGLATMLPATTRAAVWFVTNNAAGTGAGWGDAMALTNALFTAAGGDQVWVAQGTYRDVSPFRLKASVELYGGFTSGMATLAERDWAAHPSLLDGQGVRRVLIGTNNAVLDGFVVANGLVFGSESGGGLLVQGSVMAIRNCLFTNNAAGGGTGYGGALAQTGAGSATVISNCVFRGNSAAYGGAVYWAAGTATVSRCRFTGNSATMGGGALYPLGLSGAVEDTVFAGNTAASAGGGAVYSGSRANCLAAFRRCVFANNFAGGGSGWGGAFVGADAYTMEDCVFSGNRTASWGGALFGGDNSTVARRCVFAGNEAVSGAGAGYYYGVGAYVPAYENCLFAGNAAPGQGGALYAHSNSRYDLRHNTFAGNRANYGGAVYHYGGAVLFTMTNCVLWGNSASVTGAQLYAGTAGMLGVSYSDVQGGWSGTGVSNLDVDPQFAGGPTGVWTAAGAFDADAGQTALTDSSAVWAVNAYRGLTVNPDTAQELQFVIASNSTDTLYAWGNALTNRAGTAVARAGGGFRIQNYRPQVLSPVIDAAANAGVTNDLAGAARPLNDGFDMGAYEVDVPVVLYTLQTAPEGLAVQADAASAPAPRAMTWKTNSVHAIGVASPQAGGAGTQFVFSAWSDGGAQSHSVTAEVDGTTLTAAFAAQLLWTTAVEPVAAAGAVAPAGGTWYDLGTVVTAEAVAASGWVFTNWAGSVAGTDPLLNVTMDQARHAVAQFAPTGTVVRVYGAPFGRPVEVDGTPMTTNMFSWQPGEVHTLSVAATQGVDSVRYVFTRWEDGSTATQRLFTTGADATNLVAQFKTQYELTWTVRPDAGLGSILPPSGTFFDAGSTAALAAVPAAGVPFGRWTGAASGTSTNAAVLMDAPKQVSAVFYYGSAGRIIYVDDSASGNSSGQNWFDALTGLSQALSQAVAGDEIWVAQGTYADTATFAMKPGVNLYGGFGGWEGSAEARDWSAHPSVLDGRGARRVIAVTSNAVLDGFIITNGASATGGGGTAITGPAVIRNCTFVNNAATASSYGGAIAQSGAGSLAVISNCVFRGNTAYFGGVFHWAGGTILISESTFIRNSSSGGGGVAYATSVSGVVERCTFVGNTGGSSGGGVYYNQGRLNCTATNRNCVFADNTSTGTGGAFVNVDSFVFEDCIFSGNRSASYGGAAFSSDSATVFRRSLFAGNESGHASYGGSAMFYQGSATAPTFENCILAGNQSVGPGGALNAYSTAGFTIRHTTIAGNRTAGTGGGITCGNGTVQIVNSVLWGNTAGGSGQEIFESTPGTAIVLYSDVRGGWTGAGNLNADPLFEGGPGGTWTGASYDASRGQTAFTDAGAAWAAGFLSGRFLNPSTNQPLQFVIASNSADTIYVWGNAVSNRAGLAVATNGAAYRIISYQQANGSPVIDAGVDFGVAEDIRGIARPQPAGGTCDMGAYEGAPAHAVAFTAAASVAGESAGTVEVQVAIDNWLFEGTGSVQVAVAGGTAVPGVDFNFTPALLAFDMATGRHTVSVAILTNALPELPRTVVLALSDPANVALGAIATHTITILDDDGPVGVEFDRADSSGMENITAAVIGVSLSRAHGLPVTVDFRVVGGTATARADYMLMPGTLVFAVGETNRQIVLQIVDDSLAEDAETVEVGLFNPANAAYGAVTRHTYTILDDNRIFVNLHAAGMNNGSGWADAHTSLATALARAHGGDEIFVAEGTYPGPFTLTNGVAVYGGFTAGMGQLSARNWLTHVTVLSGGGPVVTGAQGARLDGFTVTGGSAVSGGGMSIVNASMTVANCAFNNNVASSVGGGLYMVSSTSQVLRCRFVNNGGGSGGGGGVQINGGAPLVRNCVFIGNTTTAYDGGGMQVSGSPARIENCTFTANIAYRQGGAIEVYSADSSLVTVMKNCILWDNKTTKNAASPNGGWEICVQNEGRMQMSYTDVTPGPNRLYERGGGVLTELSGNLDVDPLFADAVNGDVHLKSEAGRWTDGGVIVHDTVTSPCIDAGDPADPCGDELGGGADCRVDMGAYGSTIQAGGVAIQPATGLFFFLR